MDGAWRGVGGGARVALPEMGGEGGGEDGMTKRRRD